MVCGSVKIGDGAWLAPQSCVREGLTIGKNSVVGLGACVINDVPDNDVVAGVPARSIKK
jgi:UDP-3-O-[3-hydroxymyristoyl] glucosamine N-acyltransferase